MSENQSPALPSAPDTTRRVVWGLLALLIAGTIGYLWWHQYVTDRCREIAYQFVTSNPPPRPSDLAWGAEHCYGGAPR